jgi:hypothetical protein
MRPGYKTRGAILGIKRVNHHDEADNGPAIGLMSDVNVKGFRGGAWL